MSNFATIKELYKKYATKETGKKVVGWMFFAILFALILNAFFSSVLSNYIPFFDKAPPSIIEIYPSANQVVYNLTNISLLIEDKGMGVDFLGTTILIEGHNEGKINGTFTYENSRIYFIPKEKMKPDIYTLTINPKDKAGNNLHSPFSSVFYLSKEPELNFWVRLSEHTFFPGDPIGELTWRDSYRYYLFILENKGSSYQSLDEFSTKLDFPYPVIGFRSSNLQYAQACEIKFPEGRYIIVDNKEIRIPSCDLQIECSKLVPGGAFSGQIFVDTNYTDYVWMCNNLSEYSGSYFWDEFGYVKNEKIEGII